MQQQQQQQLESFENKSSKQANVHTLGARRVTGNQCRSNNNSDDDDESTVVQAQLAPDISQVLSEATPHDLDFLTQAFIMAPAQWRHHLQFSGRMEERFQAEHAILVRSISRVIVPMATFIFILFHGWGQLQPSEEGRREATMIRIFVSTGCLFFLPLTYTYWFLPHVQTIMLVLALFAYTGTCLILFVLHGFVFGLAALCLNITVCTTLGVMQFRTASLFCILAVFITNILILVQTPTSGYTKAFILANTNFLILPFCLFALLTSYTAEMHLRHRFRYTGTVSYWAHPDGLDEQMQETTN